MSRLMRLVVVLLIGLSALSCFAQSEDSVENSGEVCGDNPYALCSHAKCECLKSDGTPGECKEYEKGTDTGWSVCTCPVVTPVERGLTKNYDANFANLSCEERRQPTSEGTPFPGFVDQQVADVYSTYSLGDSLPGDYFDTLDSAQLIICDAPKLMTLCLNMPCTTDESGKTVCYCQNVSINDCPSGRWNTLGGDCDQSHCDLGKKHIWSAACIGQTVEGMVMNSVYIREYISPEFTDFPKYCSNG